MASLLKKLQKKRNQEEKPSREEIINSSSSDEEEQATIVQDEKDKEDDSQQASEEQEEVEAEVDSEDELRVFKDPDPASREWKNRQRTLVVSSRGLTGKMSQLVHDICEMVPNTKRESRVNRKEAVQVIDDIAYERSCNNCMFFE